MGKKIFIVVGDIHLDGQISDTQTHRWSARQTARRTEPKSLSPYKKFWVGDNYMSQLSNIIIQEESYKKQFHSKTAPFKFFFFYLKRTNLETNINHITT